MPNRPTLKRQLGHRHLEFSDPYIPPPSISSNHPSYAPLNRQYRYQALKYGPDYKPKPKSNPFAPRKRKNRKTRKNRKN
jgi:hypothetical protein